MHTMNAILLCADMSWYSSLHKWNAVLLSVTFTLPADIRCFAPGGGTYAVVITCLSFHLQTESVLSRRAVHGTAWRCRFATFLTKACSAAVQRPNSWTKSRQKSLEWSSLLFSVTSTALPWDFYFFKLTQPLRVSTVQLLYTVKEKEENLIENHNPFPLPYGLSLRNPYRNLKSENSQDYAQKPQQNSRSWIRLLVSPTKHFFPC